MAATTPGERSQRDVRPRAVVHEPGTAADAPGVIALAAALGEDAMFVSRTLRAFVRDGRLVSIPARERKRRVVVRYLRDLCFSEERVYPEREVNMRLALRNPDVSALRRFMVDARLLTREAGEYRRGPA